MGNYLLPDGGSLFYNTYPSGSLTVSKCYIPTNSNNYSVTFLNNYQLTSNEYSFELYFTFDCKFTHYFTPPPSPVLTTPPLTNSPFPIEENDFLDNIFYQIKKVFEIILKTFLRKK